MKRIIIDTNFLMIPYIFKVDIFSEIHRICNFNYKLLIFEKSIDELKNIIERQSGKHKKAAKLALKLIKSKKISLINSENKNVDTLILENLSNNNIVATQDAALKHRIIEKGFSVITLRQKKYLLLIERKLYK